MKITRKNKPIKQKNNKSKRTKRILKGGGECEGDNNKITVVFTTATPRIENIFEYNTSLNKDEAFQDFIDKINTFLNLYHNDYIYYSLAKNMTTYVINQYNISQYCVNETNNESTKHLNKLFCYTMKNIKNSTELLRYITSNVATMNYLKLLSKIKPVATIHSNVKMIMLGGIAGETMFKFYWKQYNDDEKKTFMDGLKEILDEPDLEIYYNSIENNLHFAQIIFYLKPYFKKLCDVFDYKVDEGLNILSNSINDNKNLLFMWISFGNLTYTVIPEEHERFSQFSKEKIMIKNKERSYQSLFVEYLQEDGKKYNSTNIEK
jgi:hypothetical protein